MGRTLVGTGRALSLALVVVPFSACGAMGGAQPMDALRGTWRPVELLGKDYSDFRPQNGDVTVSLDEPDAWSANDGCNVVSGRLQVGSNGDFHADSVNQTDVACDLTPGEVLPNVLVLERATRWRLDGTLLILEGEDGAVLGTYRR